MPNGLRALRPPRGGNARRDRWIRSIAGFALLVLLCGCTTPETSEPKKPSRPNLVLIVGDDHGYDDFGFAGHPEIQTPNVDALVREGVLFPLGYSTASLCKPALRSLLTGLQPRQWRRFARHLLRESGPGSTAVRHLETLPRILGRHGYASFQGGKYFEGTYDAAGFTDGVTPPGSARNRRGVYAAEAQHAIGRTTMEPILTFLDEPREDPFFLWFAPLLPHVPFDAPAEYQDLYADGDQSPANAEYWANISWFDASVGQLLRALEERGLRENTLVVYVVDNGWEPTWRGYPMGTIRAKGSLHDRGFRTPIVFSWPGVLPQDVEVDRLVSLIDIYPTLLDFAGVPVPPARTGRSLRPLLEGGTSAENETVVGDLRTVRRIRSWTGPRKPDGFVRTRDWHFLAYGDGPIELYSMTSDPEEEENVAEAHPAVVQRLRQRLRLWRKELDESADQLFVSRSEKPGPTP